jgi:hypothetical protein
MAPAPGWYFGSRGTRDVSGANPSMGGFSLGGVQKPVDDLSAGVAGSSAGSPGPQGPGGMDVGSQSANAGGSTPSVGGVDAGNANVTGLNGDLAGTFGTVASMGLPGLGAVTGPAASALGGSVAGLLGSLAGTIAQGMGVKGLANGLASLSDGMVDGKGNPVVYTGNNNMFGLPLGSLHAVDNPNDPDMSSTISAVPDVSPNMGFYSGPGPSPSTFSGSTSDGIFGDITGMGSSGRGSGTASGVGTGVSTPGTTDFGSGPKGNEGDNSDEGIEGDVSSGPVGTAGSAAAGTGGIGGVTGTAAAGTASGPGTGVGVAGGGPGGTGAGPAGGTGDGSGAGAGPAGTGDGGASGTGGDGGVGSGPGDKRGGRVGYEPNRKKGEKPDPRRLSDKLKQGGSVQVGSKKPGADDVPVRLSRGEEVVNKNATDQFGPILDQMNKLGNRQGGFSVGRRQASR